MLLQAPPPRLWRCVSSPDLLEISSSCVAVDLCVVCVAVFPWCFCRFASLFLPPCVRCAPCCFSIANCFLTPLLMSLSQTWLFDGLWVLDLGHASKFVETEGTGCPKLAKPIPLKNIIFHVCGVIGWCAKCFYVFSVGFVFPLLLVV